MTILGTFEQSTLGAFTRSALGARNRVPRHLVVMALLTESCSQSEEFGYLQSAGDRFSTCRETAAKTTIFDQHIIAWEDFEAEHYPTTGARQLRVGILEVPNTVGVRLGLVPPSRFEDTFTAEDRVFEWEIWRSFAITIEPLNSLFSALVQPIRSRAERFDVLILSRMSGINIVERLGNTLEVFAESLRTQDDVETVRIETSEEGFPSNRMRWVPPLQNAVSVMIGATAP